MCAGKIIADPLNLDITSLKHFPSAEDWERSKLEQPGTQPESSPRAVATQWTLGSTSLHIQYS